MTQTAHSRGGRLLLSCSQTQKARSRLLSRAGRFGLVPGTTLSPSVCHGYALGSKYFVALEEMTRRSRDDIVTQQG